MCGVGQVFRAGLSCWIPARGRKRETGESSSLRVPVRAAFAGFIQMSFSRRWWQVGRVIKHGHTHTEKKK